MRPVFYGIGLNMLLAVPAAFMGVFGWIYFTLWLPITAVTIILFAIGFSGTWKASLAASGILLAIYWVNTFGRLEIMDSRRKTAQDNWNMYMAFGQRGVFFSDKARAFARMKEAAEMGHQEAEYGMGINYLYGHYTPVDKKAAIPWLTEAAKQGGVLADRASAELTNDYHFPKQK